MAHGTSPGEMMQGILTCLFLEIMAVALAVLWGSIFDIITQQLYELGIFAISAEWDTSNQIEGLRNIFYLIPGAMSLIGIYVLFTTIFYPGMGEIDYSE